MTCIENCSKNYVDTFWPPNDQPILHTYLLCFSRNSLSVMCPLLFPSMLTMQVCCTSLGTVAFFKEDYALYVVLLLVFSSN